MKERPILFNGAMVRAILRGQKTQTRRPVMPQPVIHPDAPKPFGEWTHKGQKIQWGPGAFPTLHFARHCPFGNPGDRLWVRETFYKYYPSEGWPAPKALYRADGITLESMDSEGKRQRWTPSIHMPRALSRITLEITDINVEQVQDIRRKTHGPKEWKLSMGVSTRPLFVPRPSATIYALKIHAASMPTSGIRSTPSAAWAGMQIPGSG